MKTMLKKMALPLMLVFALLLALPVLADSEDYAKTPEKAVVAFANHMQKGDLDDALDLMAAEEMAKGTDLSALIKWMRSYMPGNNQALPSREYKAYQPVAEAIQEARNAQQLSAFVTTLLLGEGFVPPQMYMQDGQGLLKLSDQVTISPEELVARLDPQGLSALELKKVYLFDGKILRSESYQNSQKQLQAAYGFLESRDALAIYQFNGDWLVHTYQLARYDKGWKISSLNSTLIGEEFLGGARRVSQQEAEAFDSNVDYQLVYEAGK